MTELELIKFIFPRIVVAAFCGLIIGWERELKHKVAGIRTHVIVSSGACIFTVIGVVLGQGTNVDPTRVIGQIITGIGFLGAGVIFKQEDKVIGVTSAAFIWLVASIGVMSGCGYMLTSILLTVGFLVILLCLQHIEKRINKF